MVLSKKMRCRSPLRKIPQFRFRFAVLAIVRGYGALNGLVGRGFLPSTREATGMGVDEEKPDWWVKNERERASMDLPTYEPSRFDDGEYVHEVLAELEGAHGCEILFIGINVDYPDEWEVRIDGESAFTVDRSRNENGNTIYHVESDAFRDRVERSLE